MKIFGYSISINVLILIGILYLIMVVNALSSSCNREGLNIGKGPIEANTDALQEAVLKQEKAAKAMQEARVGVMEAQQRFRFAGGPGGPGGPPTNTIPMQINTGPAPQMAEFEGTGVPMS